LDLNTSIKNQGGTAEWESAKETWFTSRSWSGPPLSSSNNS